MATTKQSIPQPAADASVKVVPHEQADPDIAKNHAPGFTQEFEVVLLACLIDRPAQFAFWRPVWFEFFAGTPGFRLALSLGELLDKHGDATFAAVIERACQKARRDPDNAQQREDDILDLAEQLKQVDVERELPFVIQQVEAWYGPLQHDRAVRTYVQAYADHKDARSDAAAKEAQEDLDEAQAKLLRVLTGTGTNRLPEPEDATTILQQPLPEPQKIVEGVLVAGDVALAGSGSKSFKTWMAVHLAVCVATGTKWWGFPTVRGKVFFLNFELTPRGFQRRLAVVCKKLGVVPEPGWLSVVHLRGVTGLKVAELVTPLSLRLRGQGYSLVVVDPIYLLHQGKSENVAEEMAEQMAHFGRLATMTGAAVWANHHFSKGNQSSKSSIDRFSGSGVFGRFADVLVTLTPHQEAEAYAVEFTLRDQPEVPPFCVRWEYPLLVPDSELDPSQLKKPVARGAAAQIYSAAEAFDALPRSGLTTGEWQRAAMAATGMSETTFKRLRKQLVTAGKVTEIPAGTVTGIGGKWVPTSAPETAKKEGGPTLTVGPKSTNHL